jgi:RNA polymerase primary sigma factor
MNALKQKQPFGEDGTVALYFRDIEKSHALSSEKEAELSQRIRKGDKKAVNTLVRANLRFVIRVARQYQNQGLPLADLINEGNIGLIKAAHRFDGKKNFRFISYAVWWIRQTILQALANQSRVVRVPLNRVSQIYKIRKEREKLEQKHMRTPGYEELNLEGIISDPQDLYNLQHLERNPLALDAPVNIKDNSTHMERMADNNSKAPDHFIENYSLQRKAKNILNKLNEREREIFERYFGFNGHHTHTLEEIGRHMNLTRERVRQLKDRATNRIQFDIKSANSETIAY